MIPDLCWDFNAPTWKGQLQHLLWVTVATRSDIESTFYDADDDDDDDDDDDGSSVDLLYSCEAHHHLLLTDKH